MVLVKETGQESLLRALNNIGYKITDINDVSQFHIMGAGHPKRESIRSGKIYWTKMINEKRRFRSFA